MAVTNNLWLWGEDSDFGTWDASGIHAGFQSGNYIYATKVNQALRSATIMSYAFGEVLAQYNTSNTLDLTPEVTEANLSTFANGLKSAIEDAVVSITLNREIAANKLKNGNIGNTTRPVYVNSSGVFTQCNPYAGGTAITLNGSSKASNTASFYAPTVRGTTGQILQSNGTSAPTWSALKTVNGSSLLGAGNIDTITNLSAGEGLSVSGSGTVTRRRQPVLDGLHLGGTV